MINTERLCFGCMNDSGGEKLCPICGYDASSSNPEDCLPVKFRVRDRYFIGKVLNQNGEGITYIGWDTGRDAAVTVKEYFPLGFAQRNPDKTVSIVKGGEYTFNEGLMEFIEINRAVMSSVLPALIPVTDVFEENGTVYAVSQQLSGISLKSFLQKNGGTLKWEQARPLFLPLIDTVKGMNDQGIVHGAISVDTVMVGRDGKLRLGDYSIKKLRKTETELQPKIYPGFAAIEQYGFDDLHPDSYTDVYALCATLFRVLIGTVPPPAADRIQNDSMTIPAHFADELPRQVLAALANGLQVMPQDRTANVEIFKNELVYGEVTESETPKRRKADVQERPVSAARAKKSGGGAKYAVISAACTALVFVVVAAILLLTVFRDGLFGKKGEESSNSEVSSTAPIVESIGAIDSGAAVSAKLYPVPDFSGKTYAELSENEEYDKFKLVIKGKEFSDKFSKGKICSQTVAPGTDVEKDTTVELIVSLGPKEVDVPNLRGFQELNAKLELLKKGFLYENIEVLEKYDEDQEPGVVLEQDPKYGTKLNPELPVKIYVNSYKKPDSDSSSR